MRTKSAYIPVTVGSDEVEAVVSQAFSVTQATSLVFGCKVQFAALQTPGGVVGRLQHSAGDGVWRDVGGASTFTATQQAQSLGDYGLQTVTTDDVSELAQGDGVALQGVVDDTVVSFAFWVNIDGDDTEPSGAWYTNADVQIPIDVETDGDAADVAAAIALAAADFQDAVDAFTITVNDNVVTFTSNEFGELSAGASHNEDQSGESALAVALVAAGADRSYIDDTTITSGSDAFTTGDRLVVSSTGDLPPTLSDLNSVYAIQLDEFTFQLAASQADAAAGTPLDISGGSGTLTVAKADYDIRLSAFNSSDTPYLPLWPTARVVLETAAGDSATLQDVRVIA